MPDGNGIGPFLPRGQIDTTQHGIPVDYRLIMLQVRGIGILGDLAILVVTTLILGRWGMRDWGGFWRWLWVRGGWQVPLWWMLAWWIIPLCFGVYRLLAEVSDPNYSTPRQPVPPEYQRDGPRWPWSAPIPMPTQGESEEEDVDQRQWTVRGQVDSEENPKSVYVEFNLQERDIPQWHAYCAARQGAKAPEWSVRGMAAYKLNFKQINAAFLSRGFSYATKRYKDGRQEYGLTKRGEAQVRAFGMQMPEV